MIDVHELEDYARRCEAAALDLKPYLGKTLDEIGQEFLRMVQESIIAKGNVDFGKLRDSFRKGGDGNIYQIDYEGLSLTLGSSIEYAQHVNKGHKQEPGKFIPGYWVGNHFRHDRDAKGGMVLKANRVKGSGFFDVAENGASRIMDTYTERAFKQFWHRYFD